MQSWQSVLANTFSRIFIKPLFNPKRDFYNARRTFNKLDKINLNMDKSFSRTNFSVDGLTYQWIKNPKWDQHGIILYLHGAGVAFAHQACTASS